MTPEEIEALTDDEARAYHECLDAFLLAKGREYLKGLGWTNAASLSVETVLHLCGMCPENCPWE
jgi:hypothetical protein